MEKMGILTLIPTPLSETGHLEPVAFNLLNKAAREDNANSIFAIEDLKPGRKRWLSFNLPRETIEYFVCYNEHTAKEVSINLLNELKKGKNVFLMSDGGLPAFYDPGIELVQLCHQHKIRVTSTPFPNSILLALALSGFAHQKFWFEGFLPTEANERKIGIKNLLNLKTTSILMDTPYRLKRVLEEFNAEWGNSKKKIFLGMDLNREDEELLIGVPKELLGRISQYKREFVLVLSE